VVGGPETSGDGLATDRDERHVRRNWAGFLAKAVKGKSNCTSNSESTASCVFEYFVYFGCFEFLFFLAPKLADP
jgi:hypothetical protein